MSAATGGRLRNLPRQPPMTASFVIRDARAEEHQPLGLLMVDVYSSLDGFPGRAEQPGYYALLADVGSFAARPGARVLVAVAEDGELIGGVVYFGDLSHYGAGGTAISIPNASGVRLLAVRAEHRGSGAGKALTVACLDAARAAGHAEVILHTTAAMQVAWQMYARLGFVRAADLDFLQHGLPVFGFRLRLG